ncbi:hypothetical protein SAMN05444358_11621 [Ruegeria halocynthiae]|uniref:Uncharacterized protein n=1 Tax=Ruegeria halocynthiae TaxID=985054 RepID=A0A1H3FLG7_9RHOB|nr:hypothetical protein [Ruegeria halocynthiae]SDX91902.1 hypothetical protein SAMN05444358_11621 [Ruegeria halocynthiae]
MKYADPREFVSHRKATVPSAEDSLTFLEKIRESFRSLLTKRNDPTRMSKVERQDSGISEADVDWHIALHGPLVK